MSQAGWGHGIWLHLSAWAAQQLAAVQTQSQPSVFAAHAVAFLHPAADMLEDTCLTIFCTSVAGFERAP